MLEHVHDVRATDTTRVVNPRILEAALLELARALVGIGHHVRLLAEGDGARGTGLHAGGLQAHTDPVRTQRALVGLVVLLRDPGDIEGTPGDAVAAADAVVLLEVDDAVGILHDGAGRRAGLEAARIGAVHAAVLADQPLHRTLGVFHLGKAHQRPGLIGQVRGVVIDAHVGADVVGQVVPLAAGHLTGLAPDALGFIDELGHLHPLPHGGRGGGGRGAGDDVHRCLHGHRSLLTLSRCSPGTT